ncbi:hypothetical protein EGM88_09970 [Aureibaculum marinum]|uniref:Thiamine-binding protein domain-containing protein n=1 Tax=Aureibaculum marinum TaxID=2487930 RepID=A0A3N4NQ77_9FLAO|nr:thiamine-binding protein [Aureibaculum marinum]RPD96677.1 hypothetical protein EGM88_09970 [Aureibaculum marinum]
MKISVELTFSPLQDNYEEEIIAFIKVLRNSGLTVLENPLSTQVYGDYDQVFGILKDEIKKSFEKIDIGLVYMKIVKTDRHDYERNY